MEKPNDLKSNKKVREAGGKSSWEDKVASIPSSEDEDPKPHEPRKGDMSVRPGDGGKNPPTWKPDRS